MTLLPDVPAQLAALAIRLRDGADIQAVTDPAQMTFPGVWLKWTGYRSTRTLTGEAFVSVDIIAAVPANGLDVSIPALQELADDITDELGLPDGDALTQGTVFPNSPVPMPSLVMPYLLAL